MSQKSFNTFAGTIFLIVAVVHALRILNGWDINIDTLDVPVWASWVALVVAGSLSYHGLRKRR